MFALLLKLLRNWKLDTVVTLVSGIVATLYIQHIELEHDKRKLAAAKAEYILLEQSNRNLVAEIGRQNAAVVLLQQQGAQKEKQAALQLAQARKQAILYRNAATTISTFGKPDGKDKCAALRDIINRYIAIAQKETF